MITTDENEIIAAKKLIATFLVQKDNLPYANLNTKNEYAGWVTDFQLQEFGGNKIFLDLKTESDLFLLFVLALSWSTGPWENPVFFIAHLKLNDLASPEYWQREENYLKEKVNSESASIEILIKLHGIETRKQICFRKDIYLSVYILAKRWGNILKKLEESERTQNFLIVMEYIRSIEGLGTGNKHMMKKIPLIMRELRCQEIYSGIPGDLCCVTDNRVRNAAEELGIYLPPFNQYG